MSLRVINRLSRSNTSGFLKNVFSHQQTKFARRHDRFIQSNAKDEVLARYKAKLEEKAKEHGVITVEQLQEKLKDQVEETKKLMNKIDPLKELEEFEAKQEKEGSSNVIKVRSPREKGVEEKPYKTLNSFVALDKVVKLPRPELEFIWRARFQNVDNSLNAIVSSEIFERLYTNARKHPNFILPLPKSGQGHEMHFVQWAFVGPHTTHCMITTVAEYKLHKEYAKPHTTLMFHQELSDKSGVVLMNGTVEKDSNVNLTESQFLVMNVQRFYGAIHSENTTKRLKLLQDFSSGSSEFDMEVLIEEATSLEK